MDAFYAYSPFLTLNWFQKEESLPVNIYLSNIWEDKFIPRVYELCDLFIGSMYFNFFKVDAPTFSKGARELISLYGDWYIREYFYYIKIWGRNTVHLLPKIVPVMSPHDPHPKIQNPSKRHHRLVA